MTGNSNTATEYLRAVDSVADETILCYRPYSLLLSKYVKLSVLFLILKEI